MVAQVRNGRQGRWRRGCSRRWSTGFRTAIP